MFKTNIKGGDVLFVVKIRSWDVVTAAVPKDVHLDLEKPIEVEVEPGTDMGGLFKKVPWLGRPIEDTIVILVNGQPKGLDCVLYPGDVVDLLTPIAGG